MKWLTRKQVEKAAKQGHKEAIEFSFKHWDQLLNATQKELARKLGKDEYLVYSSFCALCVRYFDGGHEDRDPGIGCGKCPLRDGKNAYGCQHNSLWDKAVDAVLDWMDEKTNTKRWEKWQKAAKAMRDKLEQKLQRCK